VFDFRLDLMRLLILQTGIYMYASQP